jgi:hypothetical protein
MIVYHEKLEKYFSSSLKQNENIKSIEFGNKNEYFYVGSDRGTIYKYSIANKQQEKEPFEIEMGQFSVDIIYRLQGITTEDIFALSINGKGVKLYNGNTNKVE